MSASSRASSRTTSVSRRRCVPRYKAALCSTNFLFLKERAGPLDDWALASRLSYFLWNSMPDRTLFDLAEKGKLKDPATLRAQVERMLNDPKAERFVVDFLDQWLDLRDIEFTTPRQEALSGVWALPARLHGSSNRRRIFRELLEQRSRHPQRRRLRFCHAQQQDGPALSAFRTCRGPASARSRCRRTAIAAAS